MVTLKEIPLSSIDANPHRNIAVYPFRAKKITAIRESIAATGFWEGGVIVREVGNRFQCAFGHHRIEAAKQELGPKGKVHVTVREEDDKGMLALMGRENLEDFNTDFLIMYETWCAAVDFFADRQKETQPLEIAKFLGWTTIGNKGYVVQNKTAEACGAAKALVTNEHLPLSTFAGMAVTAARELAKQTVANLHHVQETAKRVGATPKQAKVAEKQYTQAAKETAAKVKAGTVGHRQIRSHVQTAAADKLIDKELPDFVNVAKTVARTIDGWLDKDATETKLKEFVRVASMVEAADKKQLEKVAFALGQLGNRSNDWHRKMEKAAKAKATKTVNENLKVIEGGAA